MPSFAKLFRSKDSSKKRNKNEVNGIAVPSKPQWSDAWLRTRVDPEEVVELVSGCTRELKSRALDMPFLLLPFRPASDPSATRTFIRNYFFPQGDRDPLRGGQLLRELQLTEPMILASVIKWCWSRLPGGVVTWEVFELFKIGEKDSRFARDAFTTFIPISVDSDARKQIIFDFFDLMSAIAAHGKTNGLGGRKLSRYAGWWAFEHFDTGNGFDAGYKAWARAADAASHLFFAYLRSKAPEAANGTKSIIGLPISLQQLVQATEYPPETPTLMFNETTKVVMIVNAVSPTPYALLRRAKNFEYRDDDRALQQFSNYDDPVRTLTDECRRVLRCISSANQSTVSTSKASTSLKDASWSRFEDIGFGAAGDDSDGEADADASMLGPVRKSTGLKAQAHSVNGDFDRPTTPSWADFLSTGFPDDKNRSASPMLLPPDKVLPPIQLTRGQSSQSHRRPMEPESTLEPGELASIDKLDLDDSFWWVWISSLAGEEPTSRKAVFGRCALIETVIKGGKWMVMEEQVKGAAPEPAPGAYLAEKKGFFKGFTTRRGRMTGKKSGLRKGSVTSENFDHTDRAAPVTNRTIIAPDQQARVQAAAQELQRRNEEQEIIAKGGRRGRSEETKAKTNSVMTLQPAVLTEASQALKWASQYDKNEIRAKYLGTDAAGRGSSIDLLNGQQQPNGVPRGETTSASDESKDKAVPFPEMAPLPSSSPPPVSKEAPLPRIPLPPSPPPSVPQDSYLADMHKPAAPLPPPIDQSQLSPSGVVPVATKSPLPPSPPPSNRVSDPIASARPSQGSDYPERASSKPASSPSPEPVEERTSISKEPPSPEQPSRLQKRQAGSGIKALFGSRRPREKSNASRTTPPTESITAVAAARAALGKKSPQPNGTSSEYAEKKASVESSKDVAPETKSRSHGNASGMLAKAAPHKLVKQQRQHAPAPPAEPTRRAPPTPPEVPNVPSVVMTEAPASSPKIRSDSVGENLSRVDTNDREHADREFSTFDQGPLLDQPAFAGQNAPISPVGSEHPAFKGANGGEVSDIGSATETKTAPTEPIQEEVSAGDRWAQIRKNAAERAAKQSEEAKTSSEDKRDDADTEREEQETIESRVARIKARVAELTGNIESSRA